MAETENIENDIKETLNELLSKLQVAAEIDVAKGEGAEDHFLVNIITSETGLLIGYHGETLNSLQLLLGIILYKKSGSWVRIILDIGDYRKAREESIKEMVERIVMEVETTGQPVTLPYLTPLERRIVHMMLSENDKVISQSDGSGRDRRLTISPKPQSN